MTVGFALLCVTALVVGQQLASIPSRTIFAQHAQNALHVPWFAVLTLLVIYLGWKIPAATRVKVVLVGMSLVVLAVASEWWQSLTGRNASLHDIARNATGCASAVCIALLWRADGRQAKAWLGASALTFALVGIAPALEAAAAYAYRNQQAPNLLWGTNFASELFYRGRGVTLTPVPGDGIAVTVNPLNAIIAGGSKVPATRHPGLYIDEPIADWRQFKFLCATLSHDEPLPLTLRVHDWQHNGTTVDRFQRRIRHALAPPVDEHGVAIPYQVAVELADVAAASQIRRLDMHDIAGLRLYTRSAGTKRSFTLHRLALATDRCPPLTPRPE